MAIFTVNTDFYLVTLRGALKIQVSSIKFGETKNKNFYIKLRDVVS